MKTRAITYNVHISAQKAKLVCDLIRNKPVKVAQVILNNTDKKAAKILIKLLNSAIANATNNHGMDLNSLYIYQIFANQGTSIKRTMPRAKGSADVIVKRHAHLEIVLSDSKNQLAEDKVEIKGKVKKPKGKKDIVYKPETARNKKSIKNAEQLDAIADKEAKVLDNKKEIEI
ncbi:hypothetical protein FACS189459_4440 [Bacilli bacterium]|nr:hypothetical protein FACS189459_4440 [Bacilli bacterium]